MALVWSASGPARTFEGAEARASLELATYEPRATPAHRLTVDVTAGEPETHHLLVTYPAAFRFLGAQPGAPVGGYEIDFDGDGTPDRVATLRALGVDVAFADVIADGRFTPALEPDVRWGDGTIEVRLPFGGDANAETLTATFSGRVSLVLAEGLVANPAIGGQYAVRARVVSVDPDTDGADDGQGQSPTVHDVAIALVINGPPLVPFATLAAQKFQVTSHESGGDDFLLLGRFVPGTASDGLDLRREDLSLIVGSFRQTIPGRAFRNLGPVHVYLARGPGITTLILAEDGTFFVQARNLHWTPDQDAGGLDLALRIGNDEGATRIGWRRDPVRF